MQVQPSVLIQSITPSVLTLGDWLAIASAASVNNPEKWAYYRWFENTSDNLKELGLDNWEAIADATGHNEQWAYYRFKELR